MSRKQRSAPKQKYIYLTQTQLSPKVSLDYIKHARHNSDDKLVRREPSTSSKYARQQEKQYSQVAAFKEQPSTRRYVTEAKQPERDRPVDERRIRTTWSKEDLPLKRTIDKPNAATARQRPESRTKRTPPSPCEEPGIIVNINPNRQRSPYREMGAIRQTDESRCLSPEKHYIMRSSRESQVFSSSSPVKDATFRKFLSPPTKEESNENLISVLQSECQSQLASVTAEHPLLAKVSQYQQTSMNRLLQIRQKLLELESAMGKSRAVAAS